MSEKIKILDLFAGVGGLSLGFELIVDASGKQIFELYRAVEIDKYACETLKNRYGEEKLILGDITKLNVANRIIHECKNKVDLVVGGIPCQSFSLLGPRSGFGKKIDKFKKDLRDNLYEHFRDIVCEIRPKIIVIENVKGILSKKDDGGNLIINKIISDFENLGYNLKNSEGKKYKLLNAADFGVPQKRERVILIGIRKDWKDIEVPLINPTHYDPTSKKATEFRQKGLMPYVTLFESIGDLPKVSARITSTGLDTNKLNKVLKENKKITSGIDKVPFNKKFFEMHLRNIGLSGLQYFKHVRPNGYPYIEHHISRSQQLSDLRLFSLMKEGETAGKFFERCPKKAKKLIKYNMDNFLDKYRKQKWDYVSTTIFAHLEKDGNRFIHPKQPRTITPREAARIQSFPDDFIFLGPTNKKFKQIGNAVPPLLSKAIGECLIKIL